MERHAKLEKQILFPFLFLFFLIIFILFFTDIIAPELNIPLLLRGLICGELPQWALKTPIGDWSSIEKYNLIRVSHLIALLSD